MASSPVALVARVLDRFLPAPLPATKAVPVTAADLIEGGARLPLVYVCDVTGKSREITGQTGSITCTDPSARGRTIQVNRIGMEEYALVPDTAVVRITVEVLGSGR